MPIAFKDDAEIQGILQELELQRKSILLSRYKSFGCIGLGLISFCVMNSSNLDPLWGYIIGGCLVILGVALYVMSQQPYADYKEGFKLKIISRLLKKLDPSLTIEPTYGIIENEFVGSNLFGTTPDRYYTEDLVRGNAGKTGLYFSDVHAEYKTETTDSKGRRQVTWHDIFKGIIFVADFNKNFNGVTYCRPKNIASSVAAWFSEAIPVFSSDFELVELENNSFCDEFITRSSDQIEARYLLTPALMEKICELNTSHGDNICLSFTDSKLYIAFPMNNGFSEASLTKSIQEPSYLDQDIYIIEFMYGIVDALDLNTRIWTKA